MRSTIKIGVTGSGYLVRVRGSATRQGSAAFHEFAVQWLDQHAGALGVDLSECDFLDSTFMGCLVDLHRRFGVEDARFYIVTPSQTCRQNLASLRLDTLLSIADESPEIVGECVEMPMSRASAETIGRHILECHRRLAETGEENRRVFGPIVEQLARDLGGGNSKS